MKRYLSFLLALTLLAALLTGCGGEATDNAGGMLYDAEVQEIQTVPAKSDSLTSDSEMDSGLSDNRKLIRTVYLNAETEDYDTLLTGLNQQIAQAGGYIESRESNRSRTRYCSMVIRIPAQSLDQFVAHVTANANVTSSTETADDVTLEYVDTEAKITALEIEQTRLLELLAGAETLSEILTIEERLSEVTYELERYASRLRTLDNQVDYATIHLSIREVEVLTPTEDPTVWQRISTGFSETLHDLGEDITDVFVWILVESPNILLCAALIGLLTLIFRKVDKSRKKKKTPPPPTQ